MAAAGGRGSTSRVRAVAGVRKVYEEFMPVSEWQQDDESHILTINLPGFTKEQINVSTEGQNIIRVRGERLVAGNKWSRFQKDFPVQENCDMNSVRAKYQGGSLTVTVQKKKLDKPVDPQKAREVVSPKTAGIASQNQDKLLPNLNPPIQTNRQRDDKAMEPGEQLMEDRSKTPLKNAQNIVFPEEEQRTSIASQKQEMTPKITESNARNNIQKGEEIPEIEKAVSVSENQESNEKKMVHSKVTDHGAFKKMHDYKKAVKGLSQLNEERQLLVNMGVAVLVIMLLSAYVTYSFTSGKAKK